MAAASSKPAFRNFSGTRPEADYSKPFTWSDKFSSWVKADMGMQRKFDLAGAVAYAETNPDHHPDEHLRILKAMIFGYAIIQGDWRIVRKCVDKWRIDPTEVLDVGNFGPVINLLLIRSTKSSINPWFKRFCNADTVYQLDGDGCNPLHRAALENVSVEYTNYLIKNYPALADQSNKSNDKPIHYAHGDNLVALSNLPGASVYINEVMSGKTLLHWRICSVRCIREADTLFYLRDILTLLKVPDTDVWKTARSPEGVELTPMQFLERNFRGVKLSSKVNTKLNEVKALLQAKMDATKPREARGSDTSHATTTSTATGASGGATATVFGTADHSRGSDEMTARECCSIM